MAGWFRSSLFGDVDEVAVHGQQEPEGKHRDVTTVHLMLQDGLCPASGGRSDER
jgi:hypothetical protein